LTTLQTIDVLHFITAYFNSLGCRSAASWADYNSVWCTGRKYIFSPKNVHFRTSLIHVLGWKNVTATEMFTPGNIRV